MSGALPREEVLDLLATRATEGLPPTEDARLTALLRAEGGLDGDYYDLAAALIDLAVDAPLEAIPGELRLRLVEAAELHLAAPGRDGVRADAHLRTERASSDPAPDGVVSFRRETIDRPGAPRPRPGIDLWRWSGWLVAAAIAGFVLGLRFLTPVAPPEPALAAAPAAPNVGERRDALIASAADLRRVAWSATDHPLGTDVIGEVVWSDRQQEGYMSFRGLAWNDPTQRQYQLWVFDAARSDDRPVDGGVFDVPATTSEVIIPIDAKLRVDEATLFAITLERPGGVVVSSRQDLVLIAPVA